MTSVGKLRAIMAATTGAFSLVGFQFFTILLMKGWRVFPAEATISLVVGALIGAMIFPKTFEKCVKVGVITGVVAGYALIILVGKKV